MSRRRFSSAADADLSNSPVGLGAIPGAIGLYFRLTLPETPRFTMDIERNVKQASTDVDAFLHSGEYVEEFPEKPVDAPVASKRDFIKHFRKWENGKVLFGCAWSWFALGKFSPLQLQLSITRADFTL